MALGLIYALFAGLRTVSDMDLGWQLATGRWIVQHRQIPYSDVLSYTARGHEWIYPVLSQVLFYLVHTLGGCSLLSWAGAAACAGTIALLLRNSSFIAAALAVLAVPLIAARTPPRAEMFSEIFFAAFVSILWQYHRSGRGPLWVLPLLMCVWVNLHLGFIAGLAMCAAYVALDLADSIVIAQRPFAFQRLQRAAPWLVATAVATLVNPWGPRIYVAISRQREILKIHSRWVQEWSGLRLTPAAMAQALVWREPQSGLWWLILAAIIAVICAIAMRRFAPAFILAAATYLVISAIRLQGPFASLVVIIGGAVLADAFDAEPARRILQRVKLPANYRVLVTGAMVLVMGSLVAVRIADLVTNRFYLRTAGQFSEFGPGKASWYPERAAAFVLRQRLPGNLFNDFNSGGFVAWSLGPEYLDYIDGRSVPFGGGLFIRSEELLSQSLDSEEWDAEAGSRNINTILVSLDNEAGPALRILDKFCDSQRWRPVFLDENGAVFLRVTAETIDLINRLQIDCKAAQFNHSAPDENLNRAQEFRRLCNAGSILIVLDRDEEALQSLQRAEQIFSENGFLHYAKGVVLNNLDRPNDAERELRTAADLGSNDAILALARNYEQDGRYAEEVAILAPAANRSSSPYLLYLRLAYAQLYSGHADLALTSFDKAEKESPFTGDAYSLGGDFRAQIAEGRRRASLEFKSK